MNNIRTVHYNSLVRVLMLSLSILVIAQLVTIGSYFLIIITVFVPSILLSFLTLTKKISLVELVSILIIIASYGQLLRGAGGYANIICTVVAFFLLISKIIVIKKNKVSVFVISLITSQIIGSLIYYSGSLSITFLGFISLLGILSLIVILDNIEFTFLNVIFFLKTLCTISILNLVIVLNTKFQIFNYDFIIFSDMMNLSDFELFLKDRFFGSFGSSELFGEFNLICYIISLSVILFKKRWRQNSKYSYNIFQLSLLSSIINSFSSFSKSIYILIIISTLVILSYNYLFINNALKRKHIPAYLYITLIVIVIFLFNSIFSFELIFDRVKENPDFIKNFLQNPLTGFGTSREIVFDLAIERLINNDFLIGYGWGIPVMNKIAWFGYAESRFVDYHNFYYSVIPIFGWILSLYFFVLLLYIIIGLIKRSFKIKSSYANKEIYFSFLMIVIFILIDQTKITALRTGSFLFIFTFILFIAYKIIKSKYLNNEKYI